MSPAVFKDQAHPLPQRPRRNISGKLSTVYIPSDEDAVFWGFSIHKNIVSVSSDRLGGVPKGSQSDFHWILVMNKQILPSEADFGQYCGFYGWRGDPCDG